MCCTAIIKIECQYCNVHSTLLSVVTGTADEINVIETRANDVIYELTYPAELLHPVTLNITYMSPNRGQTKSRISEVTYNNTKTITYKEVRSELPFSVYYVSFALVALNGSERIVGPESPANTLISESVLYTGTIHNTRMTVVTHITMSISF